MIETGRAEYPSGGGMFRELVERGTSVTAILAALIAAVLYGTGAALQQHQAAAAPDTPAGRPSLLLLLMRRPWWLLGIVGEFSGFAIHAVALRSGPLAIVQMRPPRAPRVRSLARQFLAGACIPAAGNITFWTFPVWDRPDAPQPVPRPADHRVACH